MDNNLTVGRLIEQLSDLDKDLPVMTMANNHHARDVHSITLVEHWGAERVLIGNQSNYNNGESVKFKKHIHSPPYRKSL